MNCDQSGAGLAPPNDDDESSPPTDEDDESVLENVPTDWRRKLRGLDGSRVFPSIDRVAEDSSRCFCWCWAMKSSIEPTADVIG